jgi:hypothetical protein
LIVKEEQDLLVVQWIQVQLLGFLPIRRLHGSGAGSTKPVNNYAREQKWGGPLLTESVDY